MEFETNPEIEGVPAVDFLQIDEHGRIYLHMESSMTPEQLLKIVEYAIAKRAKQ